VSLPWSGQQIEWLQALGLEVLHRPVAAAPGSTPAEVAADAGAPSGQIPRALLRAARGVDLMPLLATAGLPRDVASRRAFWRLLRPQRKASRPG
jgi:hypothetical protein